MVAVENMVFRVRVVTSVLIVIMIGGVVLQLLGLSPAVLVCAVLALATFVSAQRVGWAVGLSASLLLGLLAHTVMLRFTARFGIDLVLALTVALVLVGTACAVWLFARASAIELPSPPTLLAASAALTLPLLIGALLAIGLRVGDSVRVGWMMLNDTVWNTVATRFIVNDNGIAPSIHPNPSPLVNGLMASWIAPGRAQAEELLRHELERQNELLILMFLLCSVLAGIIAARAVSADRPTLRWFAILCVSAIPFSWYVAGFTLTLGFFNVPVSLAVLLAVWIVWTDLPRHRALSIGLLLVATTVLLVAWAPLALLPLALAGVGAFGNVKALLRVRGFDAVFFWGAVVQLPLYVWFITRLDLRRDGAALSADGAAPEVTPLHVLLAVVLLLAAAIFAARVFGQRHELRGVVALVVALAIGLGYLSAQRLGLTEHLWGYYAEKLGWLVSIMFVILLATMLLRWLNHERTRGRKLLGLLTASFVLVGVVMFSVSPRPRNFAAVFPLVKLALVGDTDAQTARVDALIAAADNGEKTIFARYPGDAADDRFINFWLLQLTATSSAEPVRSFAYSLDSNSAEQMCAAAETWGGDVVVVTRDEALEAELAEVCEPTVARVELRG